LDTDITDLIDFPGKNRKKRRLSVLMAGSDLAGTTPTNIPPAVQLRVVLSTGDALLPFVLDSST